MINRRVFLKGALGLTVVAALPIALSAVPIIHGDGIQDDWAGLQALFDGEPFRVDHGGAFIARSGQIKGGCFALSRTLNVSANNLRVEECEFIALTDFQGDFLVRITGNSQSWSRCHFDGRNISSGVYLSATAPAWLAALKAHTSSNPPITTKRRDQRAV